jgi:leucyl/phenylalanyl-tRNA--protein transferase
MSLDPEELVSGYAAGIFPMAGPDGRVRWYRPDPRAVIPLEAFHVPASLRRVVRRDRFAVTVDRSFEEVIRACAERAPDRDETWISNDIIEAYGRLHRAGFAHSVETRDHTGSLVGGLYGVVLGAAFFGESMFSRATDASKVALVHLVERLRAGGFLLLDVQFTTDHLARFGAIDIPRVEYERRLANAVGLPADWRALERAAEAGG